RARSERHNWTSLGSLCWGLPTRCKTRAHRHSQRTPSRRWLFLRTPFYPQMGVTQMPFQAPESANERDAVCRKLRQFSMEPVDAEGWLPDGRGSRERISGELRSHCSARESGNAPCRRWKRLSLGEQQLAIIGEVAHPKLLLQPFDRAAAAKVEIWHEL